MRIWVALALMAPGLACAAEGFAGGGAGWAWRHIEQDAPLAVLDLDLGDGLALHTEGGVRFGSGVLLRSSYTYADHGDLTAIGGALRITDDVQHRDLRLGAFYETAGGTRGFRLGGGYVQVNDDVWDTSRAPFLEAAWIAPLGERVTLDLAAAYAPLRGDRANDLVELRGRLARRVGRVDLTLDWRYARFDSRSQDFLSADYPDEQVNELRFGVLFTGI